jgi:2-C-methyl-D-erythritol 4-phosphate cytidylyltransferase
VTDSVGGSTILRYWMIVPAAGNGSRMQQAIAKQYLPLAGSTVLEITLSRLKALQLFEKIVVPIGAEDSLWKDTNPASDSTFLALQGGAQRSDSVMAALLALEGLADESDWVLVHDAARPCFKSSDINHMVASLAEHPVGGLMAERILDTVKQVDKNDAVVKTLDRKQLWRAQTPQMFRYGLLKTCLEEASKSGAEITDEASAVELLGLQPAVVCGSASNIKITVPGDLDLAEYYLANGGLEGE